MCHIVIERMETVMEKKIATLKIAYSKRDRAAMVKAAQALVAYDRKHPMAVMVNEGADEIVALARKIVAAA